MRMWEVRRNGVASEPIAESELEAMLAAGTVEGSAAVRPVGKEAWKPALRHGPFASAAQRAPRRDGRPSPSDGPSPLPPPKDPLRWDQQTQLNMPVPQLAGWSPPAPLPPPPGTGAPLHPPAVLPPPPAPSSAPPPAPAAPTPSGARPPALPTSSAPPTAFASSMAPVVSSSPAPARISTQGPSLPAERPPSGVIGGLVDFSFTTFVAPRVLKTLYASFVIVVLLGTLASIGTGLLLLRGPAATASSAGMAVAVVQLAVAPIAALFILLGGRVLFESILVFFRIAEHLASLDRKTPR